MSVPWKIYASRALSAWGDRIWSFAVGVFMSKLAPENLRVVAVYGFVISVSVIVFGAVIGNWIDRNKRLLAAKLFLAIQNVSVAVACILLLGHYLIWKDQVISTFIMTEYALSLLFVANMLILKIICSFSLYKGYTSMDSAISHYISVRCCKPCFCWM